MLKKFNKKNPKYFVNIRDTNGIQERRCTKCEQWFPETYEYFYYKNKSIPEKGFVSWCKSCNSNYSYSVILENREDHRKLKKKYYKKRRDELLDYQNNYNKENDKEIKVYQAGYRQSEHGKLKYREYDHRNHDTYDQEWESCKKFFNYRCACCGLPIEEHFYPYGGKMVWRDLEQDHTYHNGKNDLRNCIPLCSTCNNKKKRKTFNEFYNPSNPDYTYERYHQIYLWTRYEHKKYLLPKRRYKGQRLTQRLKEIESNKQNKTS